MCLVEVFGLAIGQASRDVRCVIARPDPTFCDPRAWPNIRMKEIKRSGSFTALPASTGVSCLTGF